MSLKDMKSKIKRILNITYIRIFIDFSILTLLAIIVFRNWVFTSEWPAGGDILGWINRAYLFNKDLKLFYVWHPQSFGFIERINLVDILLFILYLLTCSPVTSVKIFLFLSFLTAGFSIYAFVYKYTYKYVASLSASLFYILNHFIFSQFEAGHIDIIFSYAVAPILFILLDESLKNLSLKRILLLSLAMFIFLTGFHPQYVLIYGTFLSLFIVIYVLCSRNPCTMVSHIKNVLKICFPVAFLSLALSAFIFIPLINNVAPQYFSLRYIYDENELILWSYKNLTDSFTLRANEPSGYFFLTDNYSGWSIPDFPIYDAMFWLLLISYCMIIFHRDNYTIFFFISAIISIFMCKGPNPPFGYLFRWAWFNIPYIYVFRRPTRWGAMTAFSHSFFIALLASHLIDYIKSKRHLQDLNFYLHCKIKVGEDKFRDLYIRLNIIDTFIKKFHKFMYYLSVALLAFILVSGFILSWFFFSNGLPTYTPPREFLAPYEWIAEQKGDFKIVTVNLSPSEWMGRLGTSDFAHSYAATSLGWHLDVGWCSSFIHNKPVFQDGGWSQPCKSFVDYLRVKVVREKLYDSVLQVIGTFSYKYIVLPQHCKRAPYLVEFFASQKGCSIVYENESTIIFENKYYVPSMFTATKHIIALGGFTTFFSASKIKSFNISESVILMPCKNEGFQKICAQFLNSSEALFLVNEDLVSLVMLFSEKAKIICAAEFGLHSTDVYKNWIMTSFWRDNGHLVLGGDTLTTCSKSIARIPFEVGSAGIYDIWLRIGFAPNRGTLTVKVDATPIFKIQPNSNYWSRLLWTKAGSISLEKGHHIIELENDGSEYNDVDAVAIIKQEDFISETNLLLDVIRRYSGRIVYILEAENAFTYNLPHNWYVALKPYEGYILSSKEHYVNVSSRGRASASSSGTWGEITLWPHLANDGDPNTRWASKPYEEMPQWLIIEWDAPQKINGVRIAFERAHAVDYRVQTWNGTAWIDQAVVEENMLLERIHMFKETVETTKIRIYVTRVTELYNLVSIWELEALTAPTPLSAKIFIPREGYYNFALRMIKEDTLIAPLIRVDEQIIVLKQLNSTGDIIWYEGDPIYLKVGEHEIKLSFLDLFGKINLDQLIIYSLKDEKETISVNGLFSSFSASSPYIEYEKISPCEYRVYVKNSTVPFILVFSESYHPLWRAYIEGEGIAPIPVYSIVNGFYINKAGDFSIRVYFEGQTYAEYGLKISGITLVLVVLLLLIPSSKLKMIFTKNEYCIKNIKFVGLNYEHR